MPLQATENSVQVQDDIHPTRFSEWRLLVFKSVHLFDNHCELLNKW